MSLFLIILAAGDGKRMNTKVPKSFIKINNKTLLEHSINSFKNIPQIKKTIIVYSKKHTNYLKKLKLGNVLKVQGGKTRKESTLNALKKIKKLKCKNVLIHDAARPNTSKKLIIKLINKLKKYDAVIPTIKVADATKRVKKNIIFKNIKRDTLRLSQTPQGFAYNKIYKKYCKNTKNYFDDDAALFTNDKEKITTIDGSNKNLKITNQDDLSILRSLKNGKTYFGIGFDVHRLALKKKLYLAGIKISSRFGTLGHSDGDPVLHAIIDAILGACKMGDIGEKFSDKNNKYKNIRSTILLKNIINKINSNNCIINNIDINIIIQNPKIKKYKKSMINSISKICGISPKQINIKGKTTEKLGVIGNKKAVASEAIVSIVKYD